MYVYKICQFVQYARYYNILLSGSCSLVISNVRLILSG